MRDEYSATTGQLSGQPKKNIVFLKVHKCASSTVQNILIRYGLQHNLNFALPWKHNYIGHPEPFDVTQVIPIPNPTNPLDIYNVICHHTRFHQSKIENFMPQDTVYVAVLRDPITLFESMYSYYKLEEHYGMTIDSLLSMPEEWLTTHPRYCDKIGLNQIAFDFGLNETDFNDIPKLRSYVQKLDQRFDLVMFTEYFDESLILLKHQLNLTINDIVHAKHNQRMASEKRHLNDTMRRSLTKINRADHFIYNYFLDIFLEKVNNFGIERMTREINELKRAINRWAKVCNFIKTSAENDVGDHLVNDHLLGTHLSNVTQFCENLVKDELSFTQELQQRHLIKYFSWWQRIFMKLFILIAF